MSRPTIYCTILCIMLLSAGCSSAPEVIRSDASRNATLLLERGVRFAEKREFELAEQQLLASLALSRSIEDNHAKTVALVNLARLKRLTGDQAAASTYLAQAFKIEIDDISTIAERFHEQALLELKRQQPEAALAAARQALQHQNALHKGRERNLVARALLQQGKPQEAVTEAMQAITENRNAGLSEEEANSLRTAGTAKRLMNDASSSHSLLLQALALDKELGFSAKIALDLDELALTADTMQNRNEATRYRLRADEIRTAQPASIYPQPATIRPSSKP